MKPPVGSEATTIKLAPSADADPAGRRESEHAPDDLADDVLSDGQLGAVAGGAVRAAVRPLLSSSPAFASLPPDEQKSITKDL